MQNQVSIANIKTDFDPNDASKFIRLGGVEVQTATDVTEFIVKVKHRVGLNPKGIQDLPEFMKVKGPSRPIGLVGGGPSIKKELDKIKEFQFAGFPIVACGSSHDYLVENNILPEYCTLCDPDPITAAYLTRHNEYTKYLVALSCDQAVFDLLKDRQVYVWHCRSDAAAEELKDYVEKYGYVQILGGCTVGLRSISIALVFGHTNIHMWGFDSCMGSGDEHHAYEFATKQEEVGQIYPIRFGDIKTGRPEEGGKYYICSGYQVAQVVHFQELLKTHGRVFTPTFHGEGLLPDFYQYLLKKTEKLQVEQKKVA